MGYICLLGTLYPHLSQTRARGSICLLGTTFPLAPQSKSPLHLQGTAYPLLYPKQGVFTIGTHNTRLQPKSGLGDPNIYWVKFYIPTNASQNRVSIMFIGHTVPCCNPNQGKGIFKLTGYYIPTNASQNRVSIMFKGTPYPLVTQTRARGSIS